MNKEPKKSLSRRSVLTTLLSSPLLLSAAARSDDVQHQGASSRGSQRAISGVTVGTPTAIQHNLGDTWAVAWADDNALYAPSNDGWGFYDPSRPPPDMEKVFRRFFTGDQIQRLAQDPERTGHTLQRQIEAYERVQAAGNGNGPNTHLAFNKLLGETPTALTGVKINNMTDFEALDHLKRDPYPFWWAGSDGCTWKSSGCSYIDGALYWAVARHKYGDVWGNRCTRQTAQNASILRSTDLGRTWTRSPEENLRAPLFPGSAFATPYFIDYGRQRPAIDAADRYVYAISNNGFWDNGDHLVLGRVPRDKIANLIGADWEFFTGGAEGDGTNNAAWARDSQLATQLLGAPGQFGETGAAYLPARGRYLMISWYFSACSGHIKEGSKRSVWDFYEAPSVWGPWTRIGTHTWFPQGYYCPVICPKFQTADRIYVFTSGFSSMDVYRLTVVPVTLR